MVEGLAWLGGLFFHLAVSKANPSLNLPWSESESESDTDTPETGGNWQTAPKDGEDSKSDCRGDRFGCFDNNLPHIVRVPLRAKGDHLARAKALHYLLRNQPKRQGNTY